MVKKNQNVLFAIKWEYFPKSNFYSIFQYSVHKMQDGGTLLVMKGAPERILERCATILWGEKTEVLSKELLRICEDVCIEFAKQGKLNR